MPYRSLLALVLAIVSVSPGKGEDKVMNEALYPPSEIASDETSVPRSAEFSDCDQVMDELLSTMADKAPRRRYSISKQWGRVVRATTTVQRKGRKSTSFVTCWSTPQSGVQFSIIGPTFR